MSRSYPISAMSVILIAFMLLPSASMIRGSADDFPFDEGAVFTVSSEKPIRSLWGDLTIDEMVNTLPMYPSDGSSLYWIVQFRWPMQSSYRSSLEGLGCDVLSFMPEDSYIVHRGTVDPSTLASLPGVIGLSPYISGLKLSPVTYGALFGDPHDDLETQSLLVELFIPDEEAQWKLMHGLEAPVTGSGVVFTVPLPLAHPDDLLSIDNIKWIEPTPVFELHNNVSQGVMGVEEVWGTYGLNGTGQTVTIADTGLDTGVDDHNVDGDIHLDFDNRATIVNWAGTSPDDGHSHGTHVTGSVAGSGGASNGTIRGMAYNASIFFQAIMADGGSLQIPSNLSLLFQQAYDNGSRIHTNSWGSSVAGQYTTSSQWVDRFQYYNPEMLILFSAGNSGIDWIPEDGKVDTDSIGAPGTAKNCLTVGASENFRMDTPYSVYRWGDWGQWVYEGGWVYKSKYPQEPVHSDRLSDDINGLAAFSSRGPTDDGRIKPDVVAPGTNILSCNSSVPGSGSGWGLYPHNDKYIFMGGTSMSTPLTAGMAVLVRQYYTDIEGLTAPSGALIKASIISGAVDMTPGQYEGANATTQEVNRRPDLDQGWGRVNMTTTISPYKGGRISFIDDKEGLQTLESTERYFRVNSEEELRLTLAWSDFPATPSASITLVNDLDLILIAPNGTRYNGNDFQYPYGDTRDDRNTVEGITIPSPSTGWWKLIVNGTSVPFGPQHYAVVISGNVSDPSTYSISMNRAYYSTDGDVMDVEIVNEDLAGMGSVSVLVRSDSDQTGRTIRLNETSIPGSFIGHMMTSNVSTSNTSRLFVRNNDLINASYTYGSVHYTHSVAKSPRRVYITRGPEMFQVYSEYSNLTVKGRGDAGIEAGWAISNITMPVFPLLDDGNVSMGDETENDGNYSFCWIVPENITARGDLLVIIEDPFLGQRIYPQFSLEFNHSVPRVPVGVTVGPEPEGNGAIISWYGTNETDIDHYSIYLNSTPPLFWEGIGWELVANTTGAENYMVIGNLVDGTEYLVRVSAVDTLNYESTPSIWMNVTPMDSTPPNVNLLTTSYTIVGVAELDFTGDPDLERVEVEYFNDTDNNGVADDPGEEYHPAAIGPPVGFRWDTRSGAGGPGDVPHMILRYRGYDEANNTSNWTEASGFSVDNTGPQSVSFLSPPPRVTDQKSWALEGETEPLGWVIVNVNGEERTNSSAGGSGMFDVPLLVLDEGYNEVILNAYDRHGAGPTNRTYDITLDTSPPVPVTDLGSSFIDIEITSDGIRLNSTSYDVGADPEFTRVENTSWVVMDPTGDIIFNGYGTSVIVPFDDLGLHPVNLTVRDPAGNQNHTLIFVNITDNTPPNVNFTGPAVADEDRSVQFTSDGTTDNDPSFGDRPLASYEWYFEGRGWNATQSGHTIWVEFPHPGSYQVTLKVTDGGGNVGNRTKEIFVRDHTPPTGSIDGPFVVYLGQPVEYYPNVTDNDENFPDGAYFSWNLTYSSGSEAAWWVIHEGFVFSYNFTRNGIYDLRLTVHDASMNWMNRSVGIDAFGDLTAPFVTSIYPLPNSTLQHSEELKVTVIFSEEVDGDTIEGSVWFEDITNGSGEKVETRIVIVDGSKIRASSPALELGHTYRFVVSRGIKDGWGNSISRQEVRNYTIRSEFSLVFPDGVYPASTDVNFSAGEDIVLRFTNPVSINSFLTHMRIWAVPDPETGDGGFMVDFDVAEGENEFYAIIKADLDMGLTYNVTLEQTLRDAYDFNLDREYKWSFETFLPHIPKNNTPIVEEDEGEGEEGIDLDQYVPHLLVVILIILLIIIIFSAISRARRRKRMARIWQQESEMPSDGTTEEMRDEAPSSEAEEKQPALKYEDLYGSPPPVSSAEVGLPMVPAEGSDTSSGPEEGILWDDEEKEGRSGTYGSEDEDEPDWEEEEDNEEGWDDIDDDGPEEYGEEEWGDMDPDED